MPASENSKVAVIEMRCLITFALVIGVATLIYADQPQAVRVTEGPVLVIDRIEGGGGHTAQWNFHTPLDATVESDRSVRLGGKHTYRLAPARSNELTGLKTHRHWAAVLPPDCQPGDCGADVTGLSLEKQIATDGARFAIALFEGEGTAGENPSGVFRLRQGNQQYIVLTGSQETDHDGHRIRSEGRLAVIHFTRHRPARAWVVEGDKLTIDGRNLLSVDHSVTKEIAVDGGLQPTALNLREKIALSLLERPAVVRHTWLSAPVPSRGKK